MKKNKMMRLASMLLVLVMLTTSIIGGTFAKYTTQDSASDMARVAKWGVELQVVGNLYGDTYKDSIVKENADGFTVQSVDQSADLVAPGTENTQGFTFGLNGQPEVAGTVTTTMKIQNVFLKAGEYGVMIPVDAGLVTEDNFDEFEEKLTEDKYSGLYQSSDGVNFTKATAYDASVTYYTLEDTVTTEDYYPVVYTLAGNTATTEAEQNINSDSLKKAADLIAAELGITAGKADTDTSITYTGEAKAFVPNTDLADWNLGGETLTWAWAYGDETLVGNTAAATDKADTILGLLNYTKADGSTVDNTVEGTVVKLDGTTIAAPVEYTDYCLDTQFVLDITVTQAD